MKKIIIDNSSVIVLNQNIPEYHYHKFTEELDGLLKITNRKSGKFYMHNNIRYDLIQSITPKSKRMHKLCMKVSNNYEDNNF